MDGVKGTFDGNGCKLWGMEMGKFTHECGDGCSFSCDNVDIFRKCFGSSENVFNRYHLIILWKND